MHTAQGWNQIHIRGTAVLSETTGTVVSPSPPRSSSIETCVGHLLPTFLLGSHSGKSQPISSAYQLWEAPWQHPALGPLRKGSASFLGPAFHNGPSSWVPLIPVSCGDVQPAQVAL